MLANLKVGTVPQMWKDYDDATGTLKMEILDADAAQGAEMLKALRLELPDEPTWTNLQHSPSDKTLKLPPEDPDFDFYMAQVPLTLIVAQKYHLTKLALKLSLETTAHGKDALAYDICPNNEVFSHTLVKGDLSLDLSKAFGFVLAAIGAGPLGPAVTSCVGLNLQSPFEWKSETLTVQAGGKNTRDAQWLVIDKGIPDGTFSPYVVIRVPKGKHPAITAQLQCEVKHSGPLGWIRGCIETADTPPPRYLMKG
jgi:hypothetical protein